MTMGSKQILAAGSSVHIQVDISETKGAIAKGIGGLLTDPPRGPGLHMERGDPLGFNFHLLPEVKPSIVGLGWGGDVWWAYQPCPSEGVYDFGPLVERIKQFREAGIEVRMNFCYVPEWLWDNDTYDDNEAIAGAPEQTIFHYLKKGYTRPPKDYDKWRTLVSDTVHHLNEVEKLDVHFDIHNEPNINWFWNATLEELLEFYQVTAEAVKAASPSSKVGGAGFAMNSQTSFDWDWFEAWVKHCAENETPVDFISWHYYLLAAMNHKRVMDFEKQAEKVRGLIDKYPGIGNPEFYMTEWSYYWDLRRQPVDGFNGAYVAQSLGLMLKAGFSKALYCGPLGPSESPDSAAQALWMFNRLAAHQLEATLDGEENSVGAIAAGEEGKISLLVWDFPFSAEDGVPQKYRDENGLESIPANSISIQLNGLPSGNYRYTRYSTGERDGNVFTPVAESGNSRSDGQLTLDFDIQAYQAALVEIIPGKKDLQ